MLMAHMDLRQINLIFSHLLIIFFSISNLQVYQGAYTSDVFLIDTTLDNQQFILSNPNIDTDSLTITVTENGSNTFFYFKK